MSIGHLLVAALVAAASNSAPRLWLLDQTLKPTPPLDAEDFGATVDLDGDTLVIASPGDHVAGVLWAGSVDVWVHDGGLWTQQATLTSSQPKSLNSFGVPAVSGDTLVVGVSADGAAYVFERSGTTWAETVTLQGADTLPADWFGGTVGIDGDTIVVGAPLDDHAPGVNGSSAGQGSAYTFVREGQAWIQQSKMAALDPQAGQLFGSHVDISGDTVVIGAHGDDPGRGKTWGRGAAYVCSRTGTQWFEEAKLLAGDGEDDDLFGRGVTIDGDTIVVGAEMDVHAPGIPGDWDGEGAAYVFVRGPSGWTEQAKLTASDAQAGDGFGSSLAIAGDTIVAGATGDDLNASATQVGAAYVYVREGTTWDQEKKLVAAVRKDRALFGTSVSIQSTTVAIGAMWDPPVGKAYLFEGTDPCAPCVTYCTAGSSASGCSALIAAYGTPLASASEGFLLHVTGAEGVKPGIFYYGANGRQALPWGNGTSYQCVTPPVKRTPQIVNGGGSSGKCNGSYLIDLNAYWFAHPSKNPGAGAVGQAQLWYRDPNSTSNQTTSLSDAIEFSLAP